MAKPSRIIVPVKLAAWLTGDIGQQVEKILVSGLGNMIDVKTTRMVRGIMVEADETPGVLLEAVKRAVDRLEVQVAKQYPVFHHELGPVWTGSLQAIWS
jgi:hypothetical protein